MKELVYKVTPGHVRLREGADATTWPWPFDETSRNASWKARYAPETLTKAEAMALAGIAAAYIDIITHPVRSVAEKVFDLRRVYKDVTRG